MTSCLTIVNVAVFDAVAAAAILPERQDVRLCGAHIAAVAPHRADTPPADGDAVLDGEGRTLLPGLVDAHVHIGGTTSPPWALSRPDVDTNLAMWLQSGVTTVLDMGGSKDTASWAAQTAAEALSGPAVVYAGVRLGPPRGHMQYTMRQLARDTFGFLGPLAGTLVSLPMTRVVRSERTVRAAVRRNARLGARFTKIDVEPEPGKARGMPADLIAAIVQEADAAGAPVIAHVGGEADTALALRAGVRRFAHGVNIGRLSDGFIAELAEADAAVLSTLTLPAVMIEMAEGRWQPGDLDRALGDPDQLALVTGDAGRRWMEGHRSITEWIEAMSLEDAADNLARLRAAGVTVIPGTDSAIPGALPGPALHRELRMLHTLSGYPPAEALAAATHGAARFLGRAGEIGRVAPGWRADLLLVEGDPTADITATARIAAVLRGGQPVPRPASAP